MAQWLQPKSRQTTSYNFRHNIFSGQACTKYCDLRNLTRSQRLLPELFPKESPLFYPF